uniref:SFRICE_028480 n=1 Tax=Spodoptera frugiperda TaxID=7108 RepID=A0A2H1WKE9_SPOFR
MLSAYSRTVLTRNSTSFISSIPRHTTRRFKVLGDTVFTNIPESDQLQPSQTQTPHTTQSTITQTSQSTTGIQFISTQNSEQHTHRVNTQENGRSLSSARETEL